jgi:hypothetical protein
MYRVDGVWGVSGARALGWVEEGERGGDGRGGEVILCGWARGACAMEGPMGCVRRGAWRGRERGANHELPV